MLVPIAPSSTIPRPRKTIKDQPATGVNSALGEDFSLIFRRLHGVWKLRRRNEQVFLAHNEIGGVQRGEFKAMVMGDGIRGACLDAIAAEDAAVIVNVVDLGVALGAGDAHRFRVLGGLDVDTVRRTGGGTQEAGYTLLQTVFVALQLVFAAKTLLEFGSAHGTFAVGIVLDFGRLEHLLEGDAHSPGYSGCILNDRHALSIRRRRDSLKAMKTAATSLSWLIALCLAACNPICANAQTAAPAESMAEHAHVATPPSTSLTLTVDGKATTLSVADLQAMPQTTVTVHNEHTKVDETYTGVLLGDLLAKFGFAVDKTTHRKMLRSYLIAEGMDKYWVLYSVTEIEFSEHNANVIIATSMNGKPLGDDGQLKLIDSADKKPQRWVRNLSAITIKSVE